jgi:hypothetical protein
MKDWRALFDELLRNCFLPVRPPNFTTNQISAISDAIYKKINNGGTALSLDENSLLAKYFAPLIDGSLESFEQLTQTLEQKLSELFPLRNELTQTVTGASVLNAIGIKEDPFNGLFTDETIQLQFYEFVGLESFRDEKEIVVLVERMNIRRKSISILEKLGRYIKAIEKAKPMQKSLHKIAEAKKKFKEAESKFLMEEASKIGCDKK